MPKRNLTDRALKALKPANVGKHYDVMDTVVPAFGVRVSETGRRTFVLVARYPGSPMSATGKRNPTRRALGEYGALTLEKARAKAREWGELIRKGVDPREQEERQQLVEQRKRANSFGAVAEDFITQKLPRERKGREVERDLRREFIPTLGKRAIQDITALDVREIVKAKAATAPAQAHNLLGHIKRLFTWAIDQQCYGIEASPCDRLKPGAIIGEKVVRNRVLTDTELRALWRASEGMAYPYGPLYRMLALTGQRLSEVAEARWPEFDLARKLWIIPPERMKSDAPHVVPLANEVIDILQSLPRFKKGDHLFSTTFGTTAVNGFSKAKMILDRLMQADIGSVPHFVNHDIRRTMRTGLSALVPSDIAELVIAHARPGLRKVYDQHAFEAEKRRALELWAARLRGIVEPPAANVVEFAKARV
jgi:integrase